MKRLLSLVRLGCALLLLQLVSVNVHAQGNVLPYGLLKKATLSDGISGYVSYLTIPFTTKADLEATAIEIFRKTLPAAENPAYVTIVVFPNYAAAKAMDSFPGLEMRWLIRVDTTDHMPLNVTFNDHRIAYMTNDTTGDAAARKEAAALKRAHPEYLSYDIATVKLEVAKVNDALSVFGKDICGAAMDLKRIETQIMRENTPNAVTETDFRIKEYQKKYSISDDMLYRIRMLSVYACD